jgi:beta-galactosidase
VEKRTGQNRKPALGALSRRRFVSATVSGGAGLAALSVLGGRARAAAGDGASPVSGAPAPQRGPASLIAALNNDWLFGGIATPGSTQPGFNDSGFSVVTLPHVVTPLSWREWDYTTWEQVWIYRRHFGLPPAGNGLRTFVDFQGALTSATPVINGTQLAEHLGGYLPFACELTDYLVSGDNLLAVSLDATWQNVPPEGNPGGATSVDYLEPGGINRDVALRFVPQVFIADVFASPAQVLTTAPVVNVQVTVDAAVAPAAPVQVVAELYDSGRRVASASAPVQVTAAGQVTASLQLTSLGPVRLWDNENPNLYQVITTLTIGGQPVHDFTRSIGFREAVFQADGFYLNGSRLKLFGLNRHQIYPYYGMAMPARVQWHDAEMLKQLNCNMVRCSHYPQSPDFLDACDELGIMVWEETPGWGYLGDAAWQQIMLQNVNDMVVRDRSRPSVIIWGVQPNEAPRDEALYDQSRALAYSLDGTRQTSGTETSQSLADWNQDVFAYDDYQTSDGNATLAPPIPGIPYLVTEAVGALDGAKYYRWFDTQDIQQEQAWMHAQVHNVAGSQDAYSGLLGWCGFDYDSDNGNIYENVKWPGVVDTFRVPKPGASFYLAQGDPAAGPVIEPSFYWDFGPTSPVTVLGAQAMIWSNCDTVAAYLDGVLFATLTPDTTDYPYLAHPPFFLDVSQIDGSQLPELRLDGYVGSRLAASRSFASDHSGDHLALLVGDQQLVADGADTTRVAFRAVDRYGAPRPYPAGDVQVFLDGPAIWLGQVLNLTAAAASSLVQPGQQVQASLSLSNGGFPFEANGGVGGVYVRTLPGQPGEIRVRADHPTLGSASARITATPPPPQVPGVDRTPVPPVDAREAMTFTDVDATLNLPAGWQATPASPVTLAALAPGETFTARWELTAPSTAASAGTGGITATAAFVLDSSQVSQSSTIPVSLATTLAEAFDNNGISDDSDVSAADFDGVGNSYSAQALAAAGLTPGASFTHDGITFTWPDVASGQPDNVVANGQTILLTGTGTTLGFVGASSPSDESGPGTIYYSDGSTSSYTITLDNYFDAPDTGNDIIAQNSYVNDSNSATNGGSPQRDHPVWLFYTSVPVTAGKTVAAVTLPAGGGLQNGRIAGMHVFALGVG